MPVLLGLSLFTVLLAVVAGVRRVWMPGAERFVVVVDGGGQWPGLGCGGDGSEGGGRSDSGSGTECGRCRSGSGGEGRTRRVQEFVETVFNPLRGFAHSAVTPPASTLALESKGTAISQGKSTVPT